MTNKELGRLARYWQKALRLQDWDVQVRVVRENEMARDGRQGECRYILTLKEAQILLLDPIDWDPASLRPQDMECSLVHELIHLHAAPFFSDEGEDELSHIAKEQAIEALAKAFVAVRRGNVK